VDGLWTAVEIRNQCPNRHNHFRIPDEAWDNNELWCPFCRSQNILQQLVNRNDYLTMMSWEDHLLFWIRQCFLDYERLTGKDPRGKR
jgi:hypothetical protein